jgi:hypothetical protein
MVHGFPFKANKNTHRQSSLYRGEKPMSIMRTAQGALPYVICGEALALGWGILVKAGDNDLKSFDM